MRVKTCLFSVVAENQCGDDGVVVAEYDRYDLRVDGAPCPYGAGKDIINLLARLFDTEGEIACGTVKPLAGELSDHRICGWGIEVAS